MLLQRPTILAKPPSSTSTPNAKENGPKITIIRNSSNLSSITSNLKDENSKPISSSSSSEHLNRSLNKSQPEVIQAKTKPTEPLIRAQTVQSSSGKNQPIELFTESINTRLTTQPCMTSSVKLLDDSLQWQDNFQDYLLDQNDFLVVGVLGKKGVGKSTLMSLLAGSNSRSVDASEIFKTASKDINGLAQNKTSGINAFVTHERLILLDVQVIS